MANLTTRTQDVTPALLDQLYTMKSPFGATDDRKVALGDLQTSLTAGNDTEVQFNDGGTVAGDADFTYNKTTNILSVAGDVTADGLDLKNYAAVQSITGVIDEGLLSTGTDTTKFAISDGTGAIIDAFTDPLNAAIAQLSWSFGEQTPVYNPQNVTFVGISNTGTVAVPIPTVVQQFSDFTSLQRRSIIALGRVFSGDGGVNVTDTEPKANQLRGTGYLAQDISLALGQMNDTGNSFVSNGADLTLKRTAGITMDKDINGAVSAIDPNFKTTSELAGVTWIYAYNDGAGAATQVPSQTLLDPANYDDGTGVLAALGVNKWQNQRVWFFTASTGLVVVIQYGQTVYNSLAEAEAGVNTEEFIRLAPGLDDELLRTTISIKQGTTSTATAADVTFTQTGKFGFNAGGGAGGGSGTQDLQSTYNLSTPLAEILTDATRGALSVQRGSAADSDNVIEGKNGAGTLTHQVQGDGKVILSNAIDEAKGGDIASAATTDIGASTGNYVDVTGTTTITALGTVQAGTRRVVQFDGILTLTHNASSLILPTGANIATVAGDTATFISLGSGNWKCTSYARADGTALASAGGSLEYVYTTANGPALTTVAQRITLGSNLIDPESNFNDANDWYVIPSDGIYEATLEFAASSLNSGDLMSIQYEKNGSPAVGYSATASGSFMNIPITKSDNFLTGDTISFNARNTTAVRGNSSGSRLMVKKVG